MNGWVDDRADGWIGGWVGGWVHGCIGAWVSVWVCGCVCGWMGASVGGYTSVWLIGFLLDMVTPFDCDWGNGKVTRDPTRPNPPPPIHMRDASIHSHEARRQGTILASGCLHVSGLF